MKAYHLLGLGLLLCGCAVTTHTPDVVVSRAASMGPNGAHSGVYAFTLDAQGEINGQLWYEQTHATYNVLIAKYGKRYLPVLTPDFHLSTTIPDAPWYLSAELPVHVRVLHPHGFWYADGKAIETYTQLLKNRRDDQTP